MGAWGEGIYDDDEACDVRDTIRLLARMPVSGDWILERLLAQYERNEDLSDDGCPTFWIVVADQFEKKGIACPRVFEMALKAVESGADIEDLRNRDMEESGLKIRAQLTGKFLPRFRNPRGRKRSPSPRNPPRNCVEPGEIYSFPTMRQEGFNAWCSNWEEAGFEPDGWGALIITETGRIYDWFPYCAYTPLVVDADKKPTFEETLRSRTFFRDGVAYCLPKKSHLKKMEMELMGRIEINQHAAKKLAKRSESSAERAVICEWSICSGAMGATEVNKGYFDVKALRKGRS